MRIAYLQLYLRTILNTTTGHKRSVQQEASLWYKQEGKRSIIRAWPYHHALASFDRKPSRMWCVIAERLSARRARSVREAAFGQCNYVYVTLFYACVRGRDASQVVSGFFEKCLIEVDSDASGQSACSNWSKHPWAALWPRTDYSCYDGDIDIDSQDVVKEF